LTATAFARVPVIGPHGMRIVKYGRVLRGTAPNGVDIFIQSHQLLPDLGLAPAALIADIEQEMVTTYRFLMDRKPANL